MFMLLLLQGVLTVRNRKLLIFFLCFALSSCIAFADDVTEDINESIQDNNDTSEDILSSNDSTGSYTLDINLNRSDEPQQVTVIDDLELVSKETTMLRVSPSDTSGLKAVMLTVLGDYETVVTDYTYQSGSSGYYSHSINIERDWAWLASSCMLGLITFCTFRFIGGLLCKK